jgi:hypothetical protein
MRNYSEIAKQIINEKLMYHSKAVSDDAISTNLFNIVDTFNVISFDFETTTFESLFTSLMTSLLFGVGISEIPPFNLCFNTELPTPQEFQAGVLLKIDNVPCPQKYPEAFEDLNKNLSLVMGYGAMPCYYDQGFYGECYVDPEAVRKFLTSTAIKESKVKSKDVSRQIYDSISDVLSIEKDVVRLHWELSNYYSDAKRYDPYWDFGWWDYSMWAEESFEIEKFDKSKTPIDPEHVQHVLTGSFWDVGVWDYTWWAEETHSDPDGLSFINLVTSLYDSMVNVATLVDREQKSRILQTSILVANYSRAEERREPERSRRVQDYGELRALYYSLTKDVRDVLSIYPTPIQIRYSAAVSNLMARLSKTRGWGLDAYKAMSIDELKEEWVREWVGKGLDENILRDIFEKIRLRLEVYRDIRVSKELKRLVMKMKR